jgi:uncharacterized membrane protein
MKKGYWIALAVVGCFLALVVGVVAVGGMMVMLKVKRSEQVAMVMEEEAFRAREALEERMVRGETEQL